MPRTDLDIVHHAIVTCTACPRLRQYCARIAREKRRAFRDDTYWGRPVPGFGDPAARLLIVGLAPAAHGANRTGRVFTGDGVGGSGDFLMAALHRHGFASQPTSQRRDDGLVLRDAYITAAVRCAPPDNKPLPEEFARCLPHLEAEVAQLPNVQVVVALGKLAFDVWWQVLRRQYAQTAIWGRAEFSARWNGARPRPPGDRRKPAFGHGLVHVLGDGLPALIASYHPSRQNTNTGKLTAAMMASVFGKVRRLLR